MEKKTPTHAILKMETFNKVIDKLSSEPYKDVVFIMDELKKDAQFADLSKDPNFQKEKSDVKVESNETTS